MGSGETQGRLWGADARAWSELNEPHCAPIYEAVLDAVGVSDGTKLLDAGCGAGLAMQLAAKRGAVVTGFDASAALLEIARERNPGADIRQGDLEQLPFGDDAFDVVTSFNAVQYAADPVVALGQLRRVARPGAPVTVLVWGPAEYCETRSILGAIGALPLVEAAGLRADGVGDAPMTFHFPDLATAVRAQLTSGPARVAIEHAGEQAVSDALAAAYADNRQADGSYRQHNVFRYIVARA